MAAWVSVLSEFPVPTPAPTTAGKEAPHLEPRPKTILFDVYGSLVCSTRTRPDDLSPASDADSFVATAERFGFPLDTGLRWHEWFLEAIAREHGQMATLGIIAAEVQVDRIWESMITRAGGDSAVAEPKTLAAYREMLANPVRAFAGAAEVLKELKAAGIRLGIASNAQFYTMTILGRTLGIDPDELFDPRLVFLSFRLGFAKPNPHFFRIVRTVIMQLGLHPNEALMVGNDIEKDIVAAQAHGLHAILFQPGDQALRPAREHKDVPLVRSYESLLAACGRRQNSQVSPDRASASVMKNRVF